MARLGPGLRKHHRPGHVGHASPKLAVDEIAEPARGKAQRHERRDEIGDVEPALSPRSREEKERDEDAEEAAVEAHAALPDGEDLERVLEIVERLVEQHVAEAAAEDHAEDAVEQHVVDILRAPAGQHVLPRAALAQNDEQRESDEIHEPVPANRDGTHVKSDRIEFADGPASASAA